MAKKKDFKFRGNKFRPEGTCPGNHCRKSVYSECMKIIFKDIIECQNCGTIFIMDAKKAYDRLKIGKNIA